jgi:D-alanyl-lipoteichoic acid acyltransferase DltB (MBOAT superfamily)
VGLHLEPTYWAVVIGVGVWLRIAPARGTTAFGAANAIALDLLYGPVVAVTGLTLATGLWAILALANGSRSWLLKGFACLLPLAMFVAYKTAGDWEAVRNAIPTADPLPDAFWLLATLSFSYAFLRCLDAIRAVLAKGSPLLDPLGLAGYLFPFHMLLAGPIAGYDEHLNLNADAPGALRADRIISAASDIATGLVYKHVCAEYLRVFLFGLDSPLASRGFIDTAALFVYLFFDFAGYSRIALGVGTLMGVPTPVNFRAPFAARNVTDFFARWHMSLGGFVTRNIYVPLQLRLVRRFGVRRSVWLALVSLLACWLFVGLWHRLSWRFAAYGAAFALVVWTEKLVLDRRWLRPARPGSGLAYVRRGLGMTYVFAVVTVMLHLVMGEILTP